MEAAHTNLRVHDTPATAVTKSHGSDSLAFLARRTSGSSSIIDWYTPKKTR